MRRLFFVGTLLLLLGLATFNFVAFHPSGLRMTNLSDQSATISWLTTENGRAKVFVSESNWKVAVPVFRIFLSKSFQEDQSSKTHYVIIKNFSPEKKYYFSVSGEIQSHSFITKPIQEGIKLPAPAYGKVIANDGKTVARRAILYFNDSFSTITNETGGWSFDFSIFPSINVVNVDAVSAKLGRAKIRLDPNKVQPAPIIILK